MQGLRLRHDDQLRRSRHGYRQSKWLPPGRSRAAGFLQNQQAAQGLKQTLPVSAGWICRGSYLSLPASSLYMGLDWVSLSFSLWHARTQTHKHIHTHTCRGIEHMHTQSIQTFSSVDKSEFQTNTLVEFFLFSLHNLLVFPCICLDWIRKGCVAGEGFLKGRGARGKSFLFRRQSNECDRECVLSALIEFRQIMTTDEQNYQKKKKNVQFT